MEEKKPEKKSFLETAKYRVILGTIGFLAAMVITIVDLNDLFTANEALVNVLYLTSGTLIGIGLVKKQNREA